MRASSEGELEQYEPAIQDNLALYAAEQANPSGKFLQEDSLSVAALLECRSGRYAAGIGHARGAVDESSAGDTAQPVFLTFRDS